jgi:hypothetical protein
MLYINSINIIKIKSFQVLRLFTTVSIMHANIYVDPM